MIQIQIQFTSEAQARIAAITHAPEALLQALAIALDYENELTVDHIIATKLSKRGPTTLGVRTNRLRGSLRKSKAVVTADGIHSSIGTNVRYAAVHEFGSKPYKIVARNGKALAFMMGKQVIVRRSVNHPGHKARAPIQTGINERAPRYSLKLSDTVLRILS